jgi:hypothetical protein
VVAIPGARRPETAQSAARAARLKLDATARVALAGALMPPAAARPAAGRQRVEGEVVMVMGIPGSGKSRVAAEYARRGYLRLNRDAQGGSLKQLAGALDAQVAAGARRVVLDNTYLSRAARSLVVEAASRHGLATQCIWLDTPLADAQVNLVQRLLDRFGHLPMPEELRQLAHSEPGVLMPTSQMRALRELEAPSADEGFAVLERRPFARTPPSRRGRPGFLIAAGALGRPGWEGVLDDVGHGAPSLVFDWIPDGAPGALAAVAAPLQARAGGPVETALCPHGGGPPGCWCRPPLPGLPLAFARTHDVDLAGSVLVGTGPAHRTLASALGARYVGRDRATAAG